MEHVDKKNGVKEDKEEENRRHYDELRSMEQQRWMKKLNSNHRRYYSSIKDDAVTKHIQTNICGEFKTHQEKILHIVLY